jgi:tetratricopeptide (TPR) repeat protein
MASPTRTQCPRCRTPLLAHGQKGCTHCGLRFVCTKCGASLEDPLERFCPTCGSPVQQIPWSERDESVPSQEPVLSNSDQVLEYVEASVVEVTPQELPGEAYEKGTSARLRPSPIAGWLADRHVARSLGQIYFDLGVALAERSRDEDAIQTLRRALDEEHVGHQRGAILFYLANLYERADDDERACRTYLNALLEEPQHLQAVLPRLHELFTPAVADSFGVWITTRWAESMQAFELSRDVRSELALFLVRANLCLKEYTRALDLFQQVLKDDPQHGRQIAASMLADGTLAPVQEVLETDGNAHLTLARFHHSLSQPQEALREVDRALELGLSDQSAYPEAPAQRFKAELLEQSQPHQAAELYYESGRRYSWRAEYDLAQELLEKSQTLNPDYLPAYWFLANTLSVLSYRPEPPYVDREKIEKARQVWDAGARKELPEAEFSWAYSSRAMICEQLARLPDTDFWDLQWEAVVYLERAILHSRSDPFRWASLGRLHRSIGTEANSLAITSQAIQDYPEHIAVLGERAAILANTGKFDDALKFIDTRIEKGADVWADGVKAYILLHLGEFEQALSLIEGAIQSDPNDIWSISVRADCYRRMGEGSQAQRDYQWIMDRYDEQDRFNRGTFAEAAYQLGKLDQALKLYQQLMAEDRAPYIGGSTQGSLGLCYLRQGDLASGQKYLFQGIQLAYNPRQLEDLLDNMAALEKSQADLPHSAQVSQILEQAREQIQAKKISLEKQPPSCESELVAVIERSGSTDSSTAWLWTGATAGLARLYFDQERWQDAALAYQSLQRHSKQSTMTPPPFPEARIGLERVVDALQAQANEQLQQSNAQPATELFKQALRFEQDLSRPGKSAVLRQKLGEAYLKAGAPEEALEAFEQALKLEAVIEDKRGQAGFYARIGYSHFMLGNLAAERASFAKATGLLREAKSDSPGESLGNILWPLVQNVSQYWALEAELQSLASDQNLEEEIRLEMQAARRSIRAYLAELLQLQAHMETGYGMLPVVTPIAVELSVNLIPEGSDSDWPLLNERIPAMRARIKQEMGVNVPGVRVRPNEELAPNSYSIRLHEVPVAKGMLMPGYVYCTEDPDTLNFSYHIWDLSAADHPISGAPGCWVDKEYEPVLVKHGLDFWPHHDLYLVNHLEAVLHQNLHSFAGVQETSDLLEQWQVENDGSELVAAAVPDRTALVRFARLLRALLVEGVSIAPWRQILTAVRQTGLPKEDVGAALRATRLSLKEYLPGNPKKLRRATRIQAPESFEDGVSSRISGQDGIAFLDLRPEETQALLDEMRAFLDEHGQNVVLIARSTDVRPFMRQLVAVEFPRVYVIAEEELLPLDENSSLPA